MPLPGDYRSDTLNISEEHQTEKDNLNQGWAIHKPIGPQAHVLCTSELPLPYFNDGFLNQYLRSVDCCEVDSDLFLSEGFLPGPIYFAS